MFYTHRITVAFGDESGFEKRSGRPSKTTAPIRTPYGGTRSTRDVQVPCRPPGNPLTRARLQWRRCETSERDDLRQESLVTA